jgi:hypothetical protein
MTNEGKRNSRDANGNNDNGEANARDYLLIPMAIVLGALP